MTVYRLTFVPFVTVILVTSGFAAAQVSVTSAHSTGASIIKFGVPGAGTAAGQGTTPIGIVQGGWVMGTYIDARGVSHGFLRAPNGTITEFDAPGAGIGAGQGTTAVWGMNPALEIAGTYLDASNVYHGFLRSRHHNNVYHGYLRDARGNFVTFDVQGAGTGNFQGTLPLNINPEGEITGYYIDPSGEYHGFVRIPGQEDKGEK